MQQRAKASITTLAGFFMDRRPRSYLVLSSLKRSEATLNCPMLSLKSVLSGEEIYHFQDRSIRLREGEFLLVRESTEYQVQIPTRFETVGRCFYFSDQDASGLNRLTDLLGRRLHHAKFHLNDLRPGNLGQSVKDDTLAMASALSHWSTAWLDQLDRVDRVDPLSKSRILAGLQRSHRLIHEQYAKPWSVSQLAEAANLARASFTRSFTRLYGISPGRMLETVRLKNAADQIAERRDSMTTIALNCGYTDLPTFSRAFRRRYGVSPSAWARQQFTIS